MIDSTLLIRLLEIIDNIEAIVTGQAKIHEPLMTLKDVSTYAKVCEATIRRALAKGTLKPLKATGKKLFRRVDVDRWLRL